MNKMGKGRMMLESVGGERGEIRVQLPVTSTALSSPPCPAAVTRMGAKQAF